MCQLLAFVGEDDTDILPFFLAHYRAIGVAKFHIFVHGEWTPADLAPLEAGDVDAIAVGRHPFDEVTKSSTLEAHARRCPGEWLVLVDADEFLELPYASIQKTIRALRCLGMDELPAFLLQRASADGRLLALSGDAPPSEVFPAYDYRLADRMVAAQSIWKNKYPLARVGSNFRLSRGFHFPTAGRPSAHVPLRGVLHHFKWRDRLLRSVLRVRGEAANQGEQDAYRLWLAENEFRLPTEGLKPYSRAAMFDEGHLVKPTRGELLTHAALRKIAEERGRRREERHAPTPFGTSPAIPQDSAQASTLLDRKGLSALPGRIALVTLEIAGLEGSGGIGTAMAALAEQLSAAGHEVHVFFAPYARFLRVPPIWASYWDARGIRIRHVTRRGESGRDATSAEMSLALAVALAEGDFDVIHFPDAGGMGAASLQLRAAGLAFSDTKIVVTAHGPTPWHREGNLLPWTGYEAEISDLEASSADLADVLVYPSRYMMQWSERRFPSRSAQVVVPNSLTSESRRFGRISPTPRPVKKIAFFGRIEIRKGLDRFLAAIELVLASGYSDFEVIFLGSLGTGLSEADLVARTALWACRSRFLLKYTSHDAVDFLRTEDCLAIIPSRVDNLPYTIYECLENGIPFIASDVGGIPELVHEEERARVLVGGEAENYAERILDALKNGAAPARLSFDPAKADLDLVSLHGNLVEAARASRGGRRHATAAGTTIIVHGEGEPDAGFGSVLRRWLEDGVEVLWDRGDAGRPAAESDGAALNRLARSAANEHLLFCHLAVTPHVETPAAMQEGLASADADAVVCGYRSKGEDGETSVIPVYGGPPEFSARQNVYGARIVMVRKSRFIASGGFATETEMSDILEWEFLNRLKASGGRIHAIPSAMAVVVETPAGPLLNERRRGRLARPWIESSPPSLQGFFRMALHPESGTVTAASNDVRSGEPAPVPEVRGMDLASLLARRHADGPTVATGFTESPAPAALSASAFSPLRLSDPGATWRSSSPLASIDAGESEDNEIGRLNIGGDGRLLRSSQTYVIHSADEAEHCDFVVADGLMEAGFCRAAEEAFFAARRDIVGEPGRNTQPFVRLVEMSALAPDAVPPALAALHEATELTGHFFGMNTPLHASLARIVEVPAGTFMMPSRAIPLPRGVPASTRRDFVGLLFLSENVEGGEVYFPALDMAVKPQRGRYVGAVGVPHHEHAVLRVTSGTLLLLSFVMNVGLDPEAEGRPRLY